MKICDRCFAKGRGSVPSVESLELKKTFEAYDLCESCRDKVRVFVTEPKKKAKAKKK